MLKTHRKSLLASMSPIAMASAWAARDVLGVASLFETSQGVQRRLFGVAFSYEGNLWLQ